MHNKIWKNLFQYKRNHDIPSKNQSPDILNQNQDILWKRDHHIHLRKRPLLTPIKTLMGTFCRMTITVEMGSTIDTSQMNSFPFWTSRNSLYNSRNLSLLCWKAFTTLRLSHLLSQLTQLAYHRITTQDFHQQRLGNMIQNRPILIIILTTSKIPVTPITTTFIRFKHRMLRQITVLTAHTIYANVQLRIIASTLITSKMLTKMITN